MPLRFVNPNFHVILIHYPLGVFVLGVFLELFSFLWRRSSVRVAGRWMIVIGALLTLPAATSGIYALHDVKSHQGLTDARYEMLRWHVIYMGIASLLAVFCAVLGVGSSDHWRKRLYFPLLLGVVGAWALMVVGAWHGGETIYQHGTSVAIIKTEDGKNELKDLPVVKPISTTETDPEVLHKAKYNKVVKYYAGGELQHHLILAGFAFAFAMGALALSMRRLNAGERTADDIIIGERNVPHMPRRNVGSDPRRVTDDISVIRSFNPDTSVSSELPAVIPAGRFWLLTGLVVIATVLAGYWAFEGIDSLKQSTFTDFKGDIIIVGNWKSITRLQAHFYLGAAFLVLSLLCGFLAWLAPKRAILLAFSSLLLICVIAAQTWMGVLLTFDQDGTSLYHFHQETAAASESSTSGPTSEPATLPATAPATEPAK